LPIQPTLIKPTPMSLLVPLVVVLVMNGLPG
jgi:hypothetical protein